MGYCLFVVWFEKYCSSYFCTWNTVNLWIYLLDSFFQKKFYWATSRRTITRRGVRFSFAISFQGRSPPPYRSNLIASCSHNGGWRVSLVAAHRRLARLPCHGPPAASAPPASVFRLRYCFGPGDRQAVPRFCFDTASAPVFLPCIDTASVRGVPPACGPVILLRADSSAWIFSSAISFLTTSCSCRHNPLAKSHKKTATVFS
jgi:hypothetical protein